MCHDISGHAIDHRLHRILSLENHYQKKLQNDPKYIKIESKVIERAISLLHELVKVSTNERSLVLSELLEY